MRVKIPFGVQIVAILLAGVIASGTILLIANYKKSKKQSENLEYHTVTFAYLDGTIIGTKEVEHGKGVYPPKLTDEGVFRGWSAGINEVTTDMETHPVYHNIAENNLFYFDSVYVQEGEEFSVDVCLGGQVSLSSGELALEYDTAVLEFVQPKDMKHCTVEENIKGKVMIIINEPDVIKAETVLSELCFLAKKKDAYSTELVLSANDMKVVQGENEIPADCATLNNKVFFFKEVEK